MCGNEVENATRSVKMKRWLFDLNFERSFQFHGCCGSVHDFLTAHAFGKGGRNEEVRETFSSHPFRGQVDGWWKRRSKAFEQVSTFWTD